MARQQALSDYQISYTKLANINELTLETGELESIDGTTDVPRARRDQRVNRLLGRHGDPTLYKKIKSLM